MNFDPLSFAIGKHGDSGPVRDVVSYLIGRVAGTAGEIWQTLTNVSVASFTAVSATLRDLVVDVTPVQSGSGDPSPDNVRPISGWTGANVRDYGAELSFTPLAKSFNYNTGEDNDSTQRISTGYFPCVGFNLIVVSSTSSVGETAWCFKDANDNVIRGNTHAMSTRYFIEVPSNAVYAKVRVGNQYNVCTPSSDRGFAVNLGVTYPVSWQTEAGTVYGGSLTDNGDRTWTLTVTHRRVQVKDFGWTRAQVSGASFYRFWAYLDGKADGLGNIICEALQMSDAEAVADMTDNSIRGASVSNTVSIRADAFSTVEDLKDTTTGIGNAAIVYELATPVSYDLTADSVQALIGQNNVFADTGSINTITFRTH